MNDNNVFKRKTKVIEDDDDNVDMPAVDSLKEIKPVLSKGENSNTSHKLNKSPEKQKVISNKDKIINPSIANKIDKLFKKNVSPTEVVKKEGKNGLNTFSKNNDKFKKRVITDFDSQNEESEDESYTSGDEEDSDDDSSSSGSDSSSSAKQKVMKKSSEKKSTPIKSKQPNKDKASSISKPEDLKLVSKSQGGKVLKTKDSLVNQFLKRWWYALPKWPPEDYDVSGKLQENRLNQVEKSEWKLESNVNDKGFSKCVELDGYKFVYIDYIGKIHDLRPRDSIPSYNNFIKKPEKELYQLLIKALRNQIDTLEKSEKYCEEDYSIINNLKEELGVVESNYSRLK